MTTNPVELTAEPAMPTQAQIASARTLLDEFAQVTSHSADAEDGDRLETLYQLIEAAEGSPAETSTQPLKDIALIKAAQSLIDNWKTGNLAFAVAELNEALQETLRTTPPPIGTLSAIR
jgi:hypothetical protein